MNEKKLRSKLRFTEAARRAGLSPATLRRLVADGEGPAVYRLGRRWFMIDPVDLETWVASRRINTTSTPGAAHAV